MIPELIFDLIDAFHPNVDNSSGFITNLFNKISSLLEFYFDCIITWWGTLFNYAFETILTAFQNLVDNFQIFFVSIGSRFLNSAFSYNAFQNLQDNFVYFIIGLIVFVFVAKIIFNVFKYCLDLIIGLLP